MSLKTKYKCLDAPYGLRKTKDEERYQDRFSTFGSIDDIESRYIDELEEETIGFPHPMHRVRDTVSVL